MTKTSSRPAKDLYKTVTDSVIADLETGTAPWAKPWVKVHGRSLLPSNASTGRFYTGINILLLWAAASARGYESHAWLTFKQAKELGGAVRKGEKSVECIFVSRWVPEKEKSRAEEAGEDARTFSLLKSFRVFNIAQIDGLPDRIMTADAVSLPEAQIIKEGEAFLRDSGAVIQNGADRACYYHASDRIEMPAHNQFKNQIDYYPVALHELTHWSGHGTRCARDLSGIKGDDAYAKEELVAEMGAAFLCARLGIQPTLRHADYIASWLKVLKDDKKAVVKAASAASKAADYLWELHDQAIQADDAADAHDLADVQMNKAA